MVQTITPVVHGGRRSWRRSVALHAAGALLSAAALGAALGGVGLALGAPWGRGVLIAVAAVAIAYAARDAVGLPVPIPELRRQVPEWWRSSFSPGIASFLYGLGLGVGFGTHLRHGTLVAVAAAAVASGNPLLGAVAIAPFGLARGLSVIAASGAETSDGVAAVTEHLERWARGPLPRIANAVALVAVAVVLGVAGGGSPEPATSGVGPLALAAIFAWAAFAKVARFPAWRRSLRAYGLPAAGAAIVPVLEAGVAAALVVSPRPGAWAALILLGAFSGALVRARAVSGDRLPCGCFGGEKTRDVRIMLWRNAGLGALAILTVWAPVAHVVRLPALTPGDALPIALTAAGVALATVAVLRASRLLGAQRPR